MKVIYKDSNGSIGETENVAHNGTVYVTWNYGKRVDGEYITSSQGLSAHEAKHKLVPISEELYQEYIDCAAWSEEQNVVRAKIVGPQFDSSKNCRECDHWGADPDSEYCAHPDALKVSSVGINLGRGRGNIAFKPDIPSGDLAFNICGPEGKLWKERAPERRRKK